MKKFLFGWLAGIASLCLAGAALTPTAYQVLLNNVETYSLDLDNDVFWYRVKPALFGKRYCYRIDLSQRKDGPKFGWQPASDFIRFTYLYHQIKGNLVAETPDIKARCMEGIGYHVKAQASPRPVYDENAWRLTGAWRPIGSIDVLTNGSPTPCEPEVIRKTTVEYHFVTNSLGLRGLAVCQ